MAGGDRELGRVREGSVLSTLFLTPSSGTDSREKAKKSKCGKVNK